MSVCVINCQVCQGLTVVNTKNQCVFISLSALSVILCVCLSIGILDEVLNRLRFDSPIGAAVVQSNADRKLATHFVSEDMKVLSDSRVKKGTVLHSISLNDDAYIVIFCNVMLFSRHFLHSRMEDFYLAAVWNFDYGDVLVAIGKIVLNIR